MSKDLFFALLIFSWDSYETTRQCIPAADFHQKGQQCGCKKDDDDVCMTDKDARDLLL